MGDVNIDELGLSFVKVCLNNYWGNICFFGFFAACILWFFCRKKHSTNLFLIYTAFLFLTIYNPIFVKYIFSKLGSDEVYYRFFWLLPVSILLGYCCVNIIDYSKTKFGTYALSFVLTILIILTGSPVKNIFTDISMPDNLFKVPDRLLEICNIIHRDSEDENPKIVAPDTTIHMLIRQYDPSLLLTIDRNTLLYRLGNPNFVFDENTPSYQVQDAIMEVVYYNDISQKNKFINAIEKTKTNYIILYDTSPICDFLQENSFENIGITDGYVIYRTPV